MSYSIYKQFGRVIRQKEFDATLSLVTAEWYEKPYLKFIIWKERVKRYLKADIKLKSDNPFGCLFWFVIITILILILIGIKIAYEIYM